MYCKTYGSHFFLSYPVGCLKKKEEKQPFYFHGTPSLDSRGEIYAARAPLGEVLAYARLEKHRYQAGPEFHHSNRNQTRRVKPQEGLA